MSDLEVKVGKHMAQKSSAIAVRESDLVVVNRPYSTQSEALRGVRSRLLLMLAAANSAARIFAVVSPDRAEGRTWFTANMALLLAQLGEKTLIIDADFRNPRQNQIFDLDSANGLSDVLVGDSKLEDSVKPSGYADLDVLVAGFVPRNPQEIVSKSTFSVLLEEAAHNYDFILIDTPALSAVADAEVIAARARSSIFVARKDKTRLQMMDHYCTQFQRASIPIAGSVLLG
jgi:protein-tyrosine kinase